MDLYANDITVTSKPVDDCVNKLNLLAREINTWCRESKMTINSKKTESMVINRKRFTGPLLPISIGDNVIEYKENGKILGVYIDNKLNCWFLKFSYHLFFEKTLQKQFF